MPHVWCYPKLRERTKATERRRGWVGGWGRAREREIEKEMKVIARKKEREREWSHLVTLLCACTVVPIWTIFGELWW